MGRPPTACQRLLPAARSLEPPRLPARSATSSGREGSRPIYPQLRSTAAQPAVVRAAKRCGVPVVADAAQFSAVLSQRHPVGRCRLRDCPCHGLHRAAAPLLPRQSGADPCGRRVLRLHRALGSWRGVWVTTPTEFDREKLLAFNRLRPLWTKTALLSSQTPSMCPGRSSRGRSATAASSLPAGWRRPRGCAPSLRRGVCWATPRPSCHRQGRPARRLGARTGAAPGQFLGQQACGAHRRSAQAMPSLPQASAMKAFCPCPAEATPSARRCWPAGSAMWAPRCAPGLMGFASCRRCRRTGGGRARPAGHAV